MCTIINHQPAEVPLLAILLLATRGLPQNLTADQHQTIKVSSTNRTGIDHRSVNQEDKKIYSLFPDQFRALGAKGHYIELGAFDGSTESNTRFFDVCLGWKGLLIEGNPAKYQQLTQNQPHAHRMSFAPSCSLEEEQQNTTLKFHAVAFTNAGLETYANDYPEGHKSVEVPCGSLTPAIEDIMDRRIHFFSLDVKGSEPTVLANIDFNKVRIDMIMAESWNQQCPKELNECKSRSEAGSPDNHEECRLQAIQECGEKV